MTLIGRGLGDAEIGANWARQQDCATGVVFRGALSQQDVLHALRTEGGIFVHATLEESFCMTVLEAMAQGLPVVVLPDSGAVPWLVGDGAARPVGEAGPRSGRQSVGGPVAGGAAFWGRAQKFARWRCSRENLKMLLVRQAKPDYYSLFIHLSKLEIGPLLGIMDSRAFKDGAFTDCHVFICGIAEV